VFSVSKSQVEQVKRYILKQEDRHRRVSFQEEVIVFLKKQGIAYDSRNVLA